MTHFSGRTKSEAQLPLSNDAMIMIQLIVPLGQYSPLKVNAGEINMDNNIRKLG